MRIAVFGGSFNPPHNGHVEAAKAAARELCADKLIIVPAARPPHKVQETDSPSAGERFELSQLAFSELPNTELSDIELRRKDVGYTVDTLFELKSIYPQAELFLLMGSDMFLSFETWKDYKRVFELATLATFSRGSEETVQIHLQAEYYKKTYGASINEISFIPTKVSSTELREQLKNRGGNNFLPKLVYNEIIKHRYYGAKPDFAWLRSNSYLFLDEKRVPHVMGCEEEAVRLANRWGADTGLAAEAAILHDITKKQKGPEQLKLCEEYGIITDVDEKTNFKLLHSKTGAAFARDKFGICDEVYSAIYWHTTGRENMTLLEKIIYMADYIEPTRTFEGVDELRRLAYENIDSAIVLGLQMSLEDLKQRNELPHANSVKALNWLKEH